MRSKIKVISFFVLVFFFNSTEGHHLYMFLSLSLKKPGFFVYRRDSLCYILADKLSFVKKFTSGS